jgi:DNA-binding MarR family transcriptional regulator
MDEGQPRRRDKTAHLISRARCRINKFLVEAMRAHEMEGFAPSHGDIIAVLLYEGAMTMTSLARHINRDRSTVTTLVRRLADEGYVTFKDNPDDARSHLVYLTDTGIGLKDTFEAISSQLAAVLWDGLDDTARGVFRDTLRQIIHNFETASIYDNANRD